MRIIEVRLIPVIGAPERQVFGVYVGDPTTGIESLDLVYATADAAQARAKELRRKWREVVRQTTGVP